jgi:flagellar hook protein FlgE
MSVIDILQPSASGMSAQTNRLNAIADNVANAATVGYKRASVEFESLMLPPTVIPHYQAAPPASEQYYTGIVESNTRYAIDRQGTLDVANSVTNLAVQGKGFFVVTDPTATTTNAEPLLTRAGAFVENGAGKLVNAAGYELMGYDLTNGPASTTATATTSLVPIDLSAVSQKLSEKGTPSTSGALTVNLNSGQSVTPAPTAAANLANSTYAFTTSVTAYNNQGKAVTLDVYMSRPAAASASSWEVVAFDHASAASASNSFPYGASGSAPLAQTTLTFDSAGRYASGSPLSIQVPGGATMTLDLSQSTQLAAPSSVQANQVNGSAPSPLDHVAIGKDGVVTAVSVNGGTSDVYQIPLANVYSENNLTVLPNNVYATNSNSGAAEASLAGQNGNGVIQSGMLEQADVDVADQLSTMVGAQLAYNASAKAFQVGSDSMATLISSMT